MRVEEDQMAHPSGDEFIEAEEALIADVQFAIHNFLEAKGVSRAELSRLLGVSDARISQIFHDTPKNLTLRTIARIFRALGEKARVTSPTLDRLIPDRGIERTDTVALPMPGSTEAAGVWHREIARSRSSFIFQANDNLREDELVAA
jgi:transcriptional regulator with XRE-family HTH domain